MFVKGVYTEEEQKAIQEWKRVSQDDYGWLDETPNPNTETRINLRTADKGFLDTMACAHDYKNPLYRDAEYAKHSRWGRIIAPPQYLSYVGMGSVHRFKINRNVGTYLGANHGQDFEWFKPVYEGDSLRVYKLPTELIDCTPEGEQRERVWCTRDKNLFYNQNDELVGTFTFVDYPSYYEAGVPFDNILRTGYERDLVATQEVEYPRWASVMHYTQDQIDAINNIYANEPRRADKTRFWEDVNIGEELPINIMGPITVWDTHCYIASHRYGTTPMMELRQQHAKTLFKDPDTNITHKGIELHFSPEVPEIMHWYCVSIVESIINSFFHRLVCNWAGDDGFLRKFSWRKFCNTNIGDTIIGHGRVVRKYIDENGACLVDIDCCMEDTRGFLTNLGPTTVELPSKEVLLYGRKAVENPEEKPLDVDCGFRPGDHFRVKPRPDWPIPGGYPLEGKTGLVQSLPVDVPGYIYALMDEDCTGYDPRVVVGFRQDMIEKI